MFRPKLTGVPRRGLLGRAIGDLNRAVSDRTTTRAGDGLGVTYGPSGQGIRIDASMLMYAKADEDGVPAATDSDGNRTVGKGKAYPARVSLDEDGNMVLKPNAENKITIYNMGTTEVVSGHWLVLAKVLNIWQVVWEECDPS